ncbi:MAG: hypothetical protein CO109_07225 [Deltaproteobacteria bacterium CG_4_9_14_3_um_filter_65_9]|nr:MAG: hypothetical protein CO109_07225 [Deltaproteobacteria bacterium CG_4_9_14_3_um_filter_65_9]
MGAVLWGATLVLGPMLGLAGWRYLWLAVLVVTGICAYFATGVVIGAFHISDFRNLLRRGG